MGYDAFNFFSSYGIYLLGINIGLSFIGAAMAKKRGYSYGSFLFLGFFTTFIVGIIVAACLRPKKDSEYLNPGVKVTIPFDQVEKYKQFVAMSTSVQNESFCSGCGAPTNAQMAFCPNCGKKVSASSATW